MITSQWSSKFRRVKLWSCAVTMSKVFDIDDGPETPELLEAAKTMLRETPAIREQGFKELRELLKQNPDLHYGDDEAFLTIVLRCTHWYAESAIKLVSSSFIIARIFCFYRRTLAYVLVLILKRRDLERPSSLAIINEPWYWSHR